MSNVYEFGFPTSLVAINFPNRGMASLIFQSVWSGHGADEPSSTLNMLVHCPEAALNVPISLSPRPSGVVSSTKPYVKKIITPQPGLDTEYLGYTYHIGIHEGAGSLPDTYRWLEQITKTPGGTTYVDTGQIGPVYNDGHTSPPLGGVYASPEDLFLALANEVFPNGYNVFDFEQNLGIVPGAHVDPYTQYDVTANFVLLLNLGLLRSAAKGAALVHINFETGAGPVNPDDTVDPAYVWFTSLNTYNVRGLTFGSFPTDNQNRPNGFPPALFNAGTESDAVQPVPAKAVSFAIHFPSLFVELLT